MATIYSVPLGADSLSALGTVTLYTVPASAGPAVVRSISLLSGATSRCYVQAHIGGKVVALAFNDNLGGGNDQLITYVLYQPLNPSDFLTLTLDIGSAAEVAVGGYQFSQP